MIELYDYQELMEHGTRLEFQNGKQFVVAVAPCGAGKTILMTSISLKARINGNRTLIVVHRQELLDQTSKTLTTMGVSHGIVAAGYPMNPHEMIQVASIQTVIRRTNKIHPPQIIIFDECHHAAAATWRKLLEIYPNALVIGFTATPIRLGGQGLRDIFQSMVLGPTVKKLIEWKKLTPFKYLAPPVKADLAGLKTVKYGDYDQKEIAMRMDKSEIIGDQIKQYLKFAPGMKAVCYCSSIAHSQHTAEAFRRAGISAMHIDGETPKIAREAATADFRDGKIKILTNVGLISEGYDVPSMEAVILARPTQSLSLHVQQSMRPMRFDKNNPDKVAIIIDAVGNCYRHGLPDEDREWSLEGKKKKPSEQIEIPMKVCPKCYGVHRPGPICEYCGHIYPKEERAEPEQRAGELAEIVELEKKKLRQEVGRARDVVTLEQIAMQRGYSPHWVRHQCEYKKIPFGQES